MGSHSNPESPTAVGRIRTRTDHATEGISARFEPDFRISAVPEQGTLLVGGGTFTKKTAAPGGTEPQFREETLDPLRSELSQ